MHDDASRAVKSTKEFIGSGKLGEEAGKAVTKTKEFVTSGKIQDKASAAVKGAKEYVGSGRLKSDAVRTVDSVKSVFTGEDAVARRKAEEKGRPEGEIVDVESVSEVPEEDEDNKNE